MELCRDFFVRSVEALVVSCCQLMSAIFASFLLLLLSVVLSSVVANVAQDAHGYCLNGKAIDDVPKTGIELLATVLSLFVVAFCALALCARCLSLRALFCLNLLALLHGEALGYEVIGALLLEVSRKILSDPGCSLF
jgi:hypothetical protein